MIPNSKMEQFTSFILNRLGCFLLRCISLGTADIPAHGYREYHPLKASHVTETPPKTQQTTAKAHSPQVFARTNFSVTHQAKENFFALTQGTSPTTQALLAKIPPDTLLQLLDIPCSHSTFPYCFKAVKRHAKVTLSDLKTDTFTLYLEVNSYLYHPGSDIHEISNKEKLLDLQKQLYALLIKITIAEEAHNQNPHT